MNLTEQQHEGIRKLYAAGMSVHVIAELYGVSPSDVMDIVLELHGVSLSEVMDIVLGGYSK